VRHPYDRRRAGQLIEELGYVKAADGIYRSPGGQRLSVELRSTGDPGPDKAIFAVADAWSRLGVATDPFLVPPQRATDREYGATFPGFRMIRQPNEASDLVRFHSSAAPLPENRFVGNNFARYVNADFDVLLDRFLSTIPYEERLVALAPVVGHLAQQLNVMGMWYELDLQFRSRQIRNLKATNALYWQIPAWDLAR
jgi:ABC-type transport system substrate-binding protein